MPTLEFFGYSYEESTSLVHLAKQLFADLSFRENIVFVIRQHEQSKVIGWDGNPYPFIRIFTRSKERAQLLLERLHAHTDVEIVFIDFYPREAPG